MGLHDAMEATGLAMEVAGVAAIVVSAGVALWMFAFQALHERAPSQAWSRSRLVLARGILLGLEFLVAADIIGTVVTAPSFESVGVLGIIVAIRTFLSLALQVETEGRWPWQRQDTADAAAAPHSPPS